MKAIILALSFMSSVATVSSCRTTGSPQASKTLDSTPNPAPAARFVVWFQDLVPALDSGLSADQAADKLLQGDARIPAFNLQALGRLYESYDTRFKDMRKDFKNLEDGIGEYDKWSKVLSAGIANGATQAKIDELKAKKKEAKKKLKELLESKAWVVAQGDPKLRQYRMMVEAYPWPTYDEDRQKVLAFLVAQLEKFKATEWDFSHLEHGNGLHEFRRELRWYLIEARVLNGLVTFLPPEQACQNPVYAPLVTAPIAQSKYGKLPRAAIETSPCFISQCLFLGSVTAVTEIGEIKDKAEQLLNTTSPADPDLVPQEMQAEAAAVFQKYRDNNLMPQTIQELRSCMQ